MKRSTLILLKTLAWIAALIPLARLIWGAVQNQLGPDPTAEIANLTGITALWLLAISLAISPLRKLVPKLSWLIRFRRLAGLFCFFYACVHMLTWIGLYNYFDPSRMADDLTKRRFIFIGMATWLLLLPLALTSTQWAIRKMGGRNWNRLHSLVYIAAVTALIHYWWKVKTGVLEPLPFTVVIGALLLARPALAFAQRRKKQRAVAV